MPGENEEESVDVSDDSDDSDNDDSDDDSSSDSDSSDINVVSESDSEEGEDWYPPESVWNRIRSYQQTQGVAWISPVKKRRVGDV